MEHDMRPTGILPIGILCVMPLAAQWFHYPTAGVPRLADGKPNLNAPTPRTSGGKPDLSGIWLAGNALPCPADLRDGDDCLEKIPLSHEAVDFAFSLPGGLPYQPWAAALVKQRAADHAKDDPHARCLPPNFPRAFAFPHLQKIIQIPGLVVILDEFNASYRQIFTDARPLPDDPQPSWNGYSSGKWEGDALVVETTGFKDQGWIDEEGTPISSAASVRERFRRLNYGTLEIEITVDDPKTFTRPWSFKLDQQLMPDTELIEFVCAENNTSLNHLVGK